MSGNFEKKMDGLWLVSGQAHIYNGLWVRCKARKATTCAATDQPINPGFIVYRPLTNSKERWQRVHEGYFDEVTQ